MATVFRTAFELVGDFLRKFGLPKYDEEEKPVLLSDEVFLFRLQHIHEELNELMDAHRKKDLPAFADALADLEYLVCGTAHFANINLDLVFAEVHRANLQKVRAENIYNKRGSKIDVIKPIGWSPPNIEGVLMRQGWRP